MFFSKAALSVLALANIAVSSPINQTLTPDIPCEPQVSKETHLDGTGNPHQNFVYKQVSGTTDCTDNPSGSAAVTEGQTVQYTFSVSAAYKFITGGFTVSESVSTGYSNSFGCAATGGASQTGSLCVFERIQLTAYTADTRSCTSNCGPTSCGGYMDPYVIYAPNTDQGSCFYDNFQTGIDCQSLGSETYVYSGPAGGPQSISCSTDYF